MKTNERNENSGTCVVQANRRVENGRLWCAVGLLLAVTLVASVTCAQVGVPDAGPGGKRGGDTMNVNIFIGGSIDRVLALEPAM